MGKLSVFNFVTLNGFYKGANEDISWHRHGAEESEYAATGANSESVLLFGRVTYEMMVAFWPTAAAHQSMPDVAAGMNRSEKIVFSKRLENVEWENTKLIKHNIVKEIKKRKETSDKNMTILGSGSIVSQFAEAGLIDEYQIMVDPIALGQGTPLFEGIKANLELVLTGSKVFKSGTILLSYQPIRENEKNTNDKG